jgi:polyisoprenoid-binding protein YceI
MTRIQSGTYTIDPAHTSVEFGVRHLMISTVKGRFADVKGTVELPESGEPRLDVEIGTASIDTRNEQRDGHLRSGDFFDTDTYPTLRFVSTRAERSDDGWKVTGDLTIKDVTKPVVLTVTEEGAGSDPWGNQRAAYSAKGKFNRSEFGLNWNAALETGGVMVSDEVKLSIDTELVKQAAAQAA